VTNCLNDGICVNKDDCYCVQTESVLWEVYEECDRAPTGWTGSDCSIPMCAQGYFDPFCTDLPQAPAGEGCYRCANGGNCTAPDYCTCADGWTGYDCRTPLCETVADSLTREQLNTQYEEKVVEFESDPCAMSFLDPVEWNGVYYARGNCTQPYECTCLCKATYNSHDCAQKKTNCEGAWQDPMYKLRKVLPTGYQFGTRDCRSGYEGNVNSYDKLTSCHMIIYRPSWSQKQSVALICSTSIIGFCAVVVYFCLRRRIRKRYLQAKIERRLSRRPSEESLTELSRGAFTNT
jgi:hypothetical protein